MTLLQKFDIKKKIMTVLPLLGFMVAYMIWFHTLETTPRAHYHVISSSIDNLIPFSEYFIVPYFLWFLLVPLCVAYTLFASEREYRRLSRILMIGMLFFLIVSTVYPTALQLRPDVVPMDNVFGRTVAHLYATDTPTNVWPSIHVFNTLAIADAIHRSRCRIARKPVVKAFITISAILIIMSTMLLKQHSIIDVTAAIVLYVAIAWIYDRVHAGNRHNAVGAAEIHKDYAA